MRIEDSRAQVGEEPESGAQSQQPLLRTLGDVQRLPLGSAHGAEQDGIGRPGRGQGLLGQRITDRVIGRATDQGFAHRHVDGALGLKRIQHLDCLGHDFRTDTVARDDQNILTQQ